MLIDYRGAGANSGAVSILVVTEKVYRDLGAAFNLYSADYSSGDSDGVPSFDRPEELQIDRASVVEYFGSEELTKALRCECDGHSARG